MAESFAVSQPPRDAAAEAAVEKIDAALRAAATRFAALPMTYPALIDKNILQRAEYPAAFPHLLMLAAPLAQPDLDMPALLAPSNHAPAAWCLSPAVCYHCYAQFAGTTLPAPLVLTARGRCFRNEAWTRPGLRQVEFEMREIVWIGEENWLCDQLAHAKICVETLARQTAIAGHWQTGEDPFFLPKAQGKAHLQRLAQTKQEFITTTADPLAIASINRHGPFFGERFHIRLPDGRTAGSACAAFGLDRWAAAASGILQETPT